MTVDLNLSGDQRQILDTAGRLLADVYPLSRLRTGAPDDLTPLAAFGAFSLSLPEALGGAGLTPVEDALVHALLGRHCVSPRAIAATLAAAVARKDGKDGLAAALAALDRQVCPAIPNGDGLVLVDPASADLALVFEQDAFALVAVAEAEAAPGLGRTVSVARASRRGEALAATDDAGVIAFADLLVSAQLLGIAEAARDLAVSYSSVRRQFGRPIGAFQAVKHHVADMAIAAEMLSAQCDWAALSFAAGQADATFQVAALRRLAPRTALANARRCVQLHGGFGFSAEADAHHLVKQAHVLSRLGNEPTLLELRAPMAPWRTQQERT